MKINILPSLLYLLQTLLTKLLPIFLGDLRARLLSYLWKENRARINRMTFRLPKQWGGIGFPDLGKYQFICPHYWTGAPKKSVKIVFLYNRLTLPPPSKANPGYPLLGTSILRLKTLFKNMNLSMAPSLLMSILGTPQFSYAETDPEFHALIIHIFF